MNTSLRIENTKNLRFEKSIMLSSYAQKFWKGNDDDSHDMKHLLHLVEEVEHNNRANPAVAFCSRACPAEQYSIGYRISDRYFKKTLNKRRTRRKKFENPLLPPNQSVQYYLLLIMQIKR